MPGPRPRADAGNADQLNGTAAPTSKTWPSAGPSKRGVSQRRAIGVGVAGGATGVGALRITGVGGRAKTDKVSTAPSQTMNWGLALTHPSLPSSLACTRTQPPSAVRPRGISSSPRRSRRMGGAKETSGPRRRFSPAALTVQSGSGMAGRGAPGVLSACGGVRLMPRKQPSASANSA